MTLHDIAAVLRSTIDRQVDTTPSGKSLTAFDSAAVDNLVRNIVGNLAMVVDALVDEARGGASESELIAPFQAPPSAASVLVGKTTRPTKFATYYSGARASLANERAMRPGFANRSARKHRRDLSIVSRLAETSTRGVRRIAKPTRIAAVDSVSYRWEAA